MGCSALNRFPTLVVSNLTKRLCAKENLAFLTTNSGVDSTKISARAYVKQRNNSNGLNSIRSFSVLPKLEGSAGRAETTSTTAGLSKLQAQELILRLTSEERGILVTAVNEYQSKIIKSEFEAESVPKPTRKNLIDIAIANAIPFVGFGFLDNFFMILFGDYIDMYFCSYFALSTMAAAALGNTFSDVLGIGTALYVERLANRIGFNSPRLSHVQMDMPTSRNFANLGRVLGVTIGCLLGMLPLLLMNTKGKDAAKAKELQVVEPKK